MESKVIFRDDQEVQAIDLGNIGDFAEKSLDDVVNDAIEPGTKFWGFPVSQTSSTEVNVGGGRVYYPPGAVYFRDDPNGVALNLFGVRPIANSKIIALIATPVSVETDTQARDFLVNAETLETEPQSVTMTTLRQANVGYIAGDENATPIPPVTPNNSVLFALVTMGPAGILSIAYVEQNRMRSLALAHQRLDENDEYRAKIGSRLDTLGSDISALQDALNGTAKLPLVTSIAFDVAQLKDKAGVPTNASSYDADHFLDQSKSDLTNPAYYARVEEGIRFPAAQIQIAQIGLANQYDATVSVANFFMLPAYTKSKRISIVGNDRQVPVAQYNYQTVQSVQKTRTRQVTRWGSTFLECSNSSWWQTGRYDPTTNIFTRNGETFNVVDTGTQYYYGDGPWAHEVLRLTEFWTDTTSENYWEQVTVTQAASGAVIGQTFLNTQDGYLANLNLFFSAVAVAGDVVVCLTETLDNGQPDFSSAIARTTVLATDLKTYPTPTPVPMALPFLKKGTRYAWTVLTAGNHSICQVQGNKYAQGSAFVSTDGVFAQGDLAYDYAFEAEFCSFNAARLEVQMNPLTLPGGIANIEINVDQTLPDGCSILHEVQINGVWTTMNAENSLLGLPALVQYRIVLLGTTDVMPGIGLGSASQITTWRPANNFKHISVARNLPSGVSTTQVQVQERLEWWDPNHHTSTCRLLYGANYGTVANYNTLTETVPIEDGQARQRVYTFNLPSAQNTYKIQTEGTTDVILETFHVAGRQDIAF